MNGANFGVAFGALRAHRVRSAITILSLVLGVATVMTMACTVQGIRTQVVRTVEIAGPTTFHVVKVYSRAPIDPSRVPKWVAQRPDLTQREAQRIRALPQIAYAALWAQTLSRIEWAGSRTQPIAVVGADDGYPLVQGGELVAGRWFSHHELSAGSAVVVLEANTARRVFGLEPAISRTVRVGGQPAKVIGVYQPPGDIFAPPGQEVGAIVPFAMLERHFPIDRINAAWIPVRPMPGVALSDAQAAVTVALRQVRRLRPSDENTFDLITQDQILETFNDLTSIFFVVMIALSTVALVVGGIGVMAIMMASVTSRTQEIGVRKAVGASRRDITQQFLAEATLLSAIGGVVGIFTGLALGQLVAGVLRFDPVIPIAATAIATATSVIIGIVFGLLPARRAARVDPIESLRYEG